MVTIPKRSQSYFVFEWIDWKNTYLKPVMHTYVMHLCLRLLPSIFLGSTHPVAKALFAFLIARPAKDYYEAFKFSGYFAPYWLLLGFDMEDVSWNRFKKKAKRILNNPKPGNWAFYTNTSRVEQTWITSVSINGCESPDSIWCSISQAGWDRTIHRFGSVYAKSSKPTPTTTDMFLIVDEEATPKLYSIVRTGKQEGGQAKKEEKKKAFNLGGILTPELGYQD